ncbi:MAG: MBL fold metallo-hydrolase [Lachnospiraceae bacterium]|jgi:ribonuclease BN (tRNA processing enzyme)|nr:MBL fold metallo-hydrolase [Lachnospiraceae bacterium]
MLLIDIINVGDGDAILLREKRAGKPDYVLLVDSGRPHVEYIKGSKRKTALLYLKTLGVDHIDTLLISHLHFDHFGGVLGILRHIPIYVLEAGYLPPKTAMWVERPDTLVKSPISMCDALNLFNDTIRIADTLGTDCIKAPEGKRMLTENLGIEIFYPDNELMDRQRLIFDGLYHREKFSEELLSAISKDRNCSSIVARVEYAGASILLTGDSYGVYWEDRGYEHCDILKVPHHGDPKSITEKAVKSVSPKYAVISCQNDSPAKKDRPSEAAMDILFDNVENVVCTENPDVKRLKAAAYDAVCFEISDDGEITYLLKA